MMNCDFAPMSIDVFFSLRGQSDPPKQPYHLSNEKRAPGCLGKRGLYYPVIWGLLKKTL